MVFTNFLISSEWLIKELNQGNEFFVFDASWYLPNENKNAKNEFLTCHIKDSYFFDIDKISETKTSLPHMLPSKKIFENYLSKFGVKTDSHIVIYSNSNLSSATRVWWTLKYFGHKKISILNGGLTNWKNHQGLTSNINSKIHNNSNYKIDKINYRLKVSFDNVLDCSKKNNPMDLIIDLRPEDRFLGIKREPREGIISGTIPNSINIPFNLFLTKNKFLKKSKISSIINKFNLSQKNRIICTCGSGITACTLAFLLHLLGHNNWSVYDGSWVEWSQKYNSN